MLVSYHLGFQLERTESNGIRGSSYALVIGTLPLLNLLSQNEGFMGLAGQEATLVRKGGTKLLACAI